MNINNNKIQNKTDDSKVIKGIKINKKKQNLKTQEYIKY